MCLHVAYRSKHLIAQRHDMPVVGCRDTFLDDIGVSIHEVALGGGPCGELRYPSYVEARGWRFPGVGVLTLS